MLQGDVVKDYLEKYSGMSTQTLARLIYKENNSLFNSIETARTRIRYYRGALGNKHRETISDASKHNNEIKNKRTTMPTLPEGITYYQDWKCYNIPSPALALVLADTHIPYHSKESIEIAVEKGKSFNVNTIVLNGDIVDFFSVSHWLKDPRQRNFKRELEYTKRFFEYLRQAFKDANIILKVGNHEERYEQYMWIKAEELLDIDEFQLEKILHLRDYGIKMVSDRRPMKMGYLYIIHGHEYKPGITRAVNPARGLFLKSKKSSLCSHFHQTSHHASKDISDDIVACWSTGCLCDMHPRYQPLNEWNHGFTIVETDNRGNYQVNNYKIINNEIYHG